jgi:hypothetical protein
MKRLYFLYIKVICIAFFSLIIRSVKAKCLFDSGFKGRFLSLSEKRCSKGDELFAHKSHTGFVKDNTLIFPDKNAGSAEHLTVDTIKLARYNVSTRNVDNAVYIKQGIQAAIDKRAKVILFPGPGVYRIKSGNYWTVPDGINLQIDGKGATIVVDKAAAAVAQETYVMAFKCANLNSVNSRLAIKNIKVMSPQIVPQWTNSNYAEHKLVIAIETDGIHTVNVTDCMLNDICGYGIRLKNFVDVKINKIIEHNVGGHFPIENGNDSFGDGIWLGHYDVQSVRQSRKNTNANISNCIIQAYPTQKNGNFASRCGITVEGFNSYAPDIVAKVGITNCTISDYDRNLHVEGISSIIKYTNCKIQNFFGIALVVKSSKTTLLYDRCTATNLLAANPKQERYGLGGTMQFDSNLDVTLTNNSVFRFNRPASFRANLYLQNNSIIDFGNCDVFFDHTNLNINSGGRFSNLPVNVPRGYNMYGGSITIDNGILSGFGNAKSIFHGEAMESATITKYIENNSGLLLVGKFGRVEKN